MESEDGQAGIKERGFCGAHVCNGNFCEWARTRCGVHTEAWHLQRELAAMRSEEEVAPVGAEVCP